MQITRCFATALQQNEVTA